MRNLLTCLLCSLLAQPVLAFEDWDWSGFASLGGGQVNRDNLSFMDYDDDWSFDSDSVVGIQLQGKLFDHLSFTTQIIAQGYHANDTDKYQPEVDWLFLSYQLSPALRMRIGRMRTPHYLFSETVDAGYSYPWVRPPTEVYAFFLTPLYNFDGLDLSWNADIGDLELDVQLFGGSMGGKYYDLDIKAEPFGGSNLTLRGDQWLLRYGLIINMTDAKAPDWNAYQGYYETLAQFTGDDRFNTIADFFSTEDQPYLYNALAGQWDEGNGSLLAEAYHITNTGEGLTNTSKGWYISWLYHWQEWTPYVVRGAYSNVANKEGIALLKQFPEDYPPGTFGAEVDQLLLGTLEGFQSFRSKQQSWALGTRYDFHPNACAKLEVKYFEFLDGTTGLMIPQPGAKRPDDAILTSFTVDVVF